MVMSASLRPRNGPRFSPIVGSRLGGTSQHTDSTVEKLKSYSRRLFQIRYWPALMALAKRKVAGPSAKQLDVGRAEATNWCRCVAVDVEEALTMLDIGPAEQKDFSDRFAVELAAARARIARSDRTLGGAANMSLLYGLCQQISAVRVLETGVAAGWSTLAILLSLRSRRDAQLDSTDMPYLGRRADKDVGIAVPDGLKRQWVLHQLPDRQALPKILVEGTLFDLVHYDSDKSYEGRSWAYRTIWPHIRRGGFMISDDLQDNMAFADFVRDLGIETVVVRDPSEEKYAGILCKTD